MSKIILISAKAESGKDTLAEYLQEQLYMSGYDVAIDHFAKYIKGYLKDYYKWDGITKDNFYRTKLQVLGTDIIKEKLNFKSFHAKRLAEDIQIVQDDFDYILIPDCRFRDEVYTMKAMFPEDCVTIRINRIGHKSRLTEEQLKHKSEVDLDDFEFDYVLDIKGGLEELYSKADEILNEVMSNE